VLQELRWLRDELGAGFIDFADDTFTLDRRRTLEFCEELARADLGLEWFARSRVDRIDEILLRSLRGAGCSHIFSGAESGSPAMLEYVNKKISREQILDAVRLSVRSGMKIILSFIYGFPDEGPGDMEASLALARQCLEEGAWWVSFQRLTALPGTPVASRISGRFDTGGAYVGGSDLLRSEGFLDEIRPMVEAWPQVFPSYFVVESTRFRSEEELQETYREMAVRYCLRNESDAL
jgi:hypothetical protein